MKHFIFYLFLLCTYTPLSFSSEDPKESTNLLFRTIFWEHYLSAERYQDEWIKHEKKRELLTQIWLRAFLSTKIAILSSTEEKNRYLSLEKIKKKLCSSVVSSKIMGKLPCKNALHELKISSSYLESLYNQDEESKEIKNYFVQALQKEVTHSSKNPLPSAVQDIYMRLKEGKKQTQPESLDELILSAAILLEKGQYSQSLQCLYTLTLKQPSPFQLAYQLVQAIYSYQEKGSGTVALDRP